MKRDAEVFKFLLREKPDETITHRVRENNKLITLRQFNLFYPLYNQKTLYFAYYRNNKIICTGTISKSEVFEALRKLAVEYR